MISQKDRVFRQHVSKSLEGLVPEDNFYRQDETVYDPTCGSGSLLLKAAAEAPNGLSIYGQKNG